MNSQERKEALRFCAWAWLGSRLWVTLWVYAGHFAHGNEPVQPGAWQGVPNFWLNAWTTFDSRYFLEIAERGYTPLTSVFFPLYPFLLSAFGPNPNVLAAAGIVLSNAAFAGSLWLFYNLTREQYGPQVARIAVWVLAFFPCAVFGSAVYSEALWLFLGLLCWRNAAKNQWLWAGFWGALAALTRNAGPLVSLALLFWWWQNGRDTNRIGWLWALLPGLAFVGMQIYFHARFGALLSSVAQQSYFNRAPVFPLITLWKGLVGIVTLQRLDIVTMLNWIGALLALGLAWRHRQRQRGADAILLLSVVTLDLIFARIGEPHTSTLRYLFGLWPFSQMLALEVRALRPQARAVAAMLALLLCACLSFLFGFKTFLG